MYVKLSPASESVALSVPTDVPAARFSSSDVMSSVSAVGGLLLGTGVGVSVGVGVIVGVGVPVGVGVTVGAKVVVASCCCKLVSAFEE